MITLALSMMLAAGLSLPLVVPPTGPNTNSYGCCLVWDAVPFADLYRVYLGSSPATLLNITNVTTTGAVFRIWQTNSRPWVGVKTVSAGQESDMSTLYTFTNYLVGRVEDTKGQVVPGTAFVLETTNTGRFLLVRGSLSNNWPRLP